MILPKEIVERILPLADVSVLGPMSLCCKAFRSLVLDLRILDRIIARNGGYELSLPIWKSLNLIPYGRYFIRAICANDAARAKSFLRYLDPTPFELTIQLRYRDPAEYDILHYASFHNYLEVVQVLLEDGRIDPKPKLLEMALDQLEYKPKNEHGLIIQMIKILFADSRLRSPLSHGDLLSLAVLTGSREDVKVLLALPTETSFKSKYRNESGKLRYDALYRAVEKQDRHLVTRLLPRPGFDIWSSIYMAINLKNLDIFKILVSASNGQFDHDIFSSACYLEADEIIQNFITESKSPIPADLFRHIWLLAIKNENEEFIQVLLHSPDMKASVPEYPILSSIVAKKPLLLKRFLDTFSEYMIPEKSDIFSEIWTSEACVRIFLEKNLLNLRDPEQFKKLVRTFNHENLKNISETFPAEFKTMADFGLNESIHLNDPLKAGIFIEYDQVKNNQDKDSFVKLAINRDAPQIFDFLVDALKLPMKWEYAILACTEHQTTCTVAERIFHRILDDPQFQRPEIMNEIFIVSVQYGYDELVKLLIDTKGVDPSTLKASWLRNVLERGDENILKVLVNDPRIEISSAVIRRAIKNKWTDILETLKFHPSVYGKNAEFVMTGRIIKERTGVVGRDLLNALRDHDYESVKEILGSNYIDIEEWFRDDKDKKLLLFLQKEFGLQSNYSDNL